MRQLMRHQRFAVRFLRSKGWRGGLFMSPGTGKTLTAITAAKKVFGPKLVICRRDDFMTWRLELGIEGVPADRIAYVDKGPRKKGAWEWPTDFDWLIVTYDLCKNDAVFTRLKHTPFAMVIADELHSIKRYKSARTKRVIKATRHIPYRIGMTGTPITNELIDVWSECRFIDDGKTMGDNEWFFRKATYVQNPSGPGWFPRKGAKEWVEGKLREIAYCVHEDDVMTLPPIRSLVKAAPMSPEQKRHYEKCLRDWELELEHETLELDQVIVQLQKLRQIASGFVYDSEGKPVYLKCPKAEMCLELLTDKDYLGKKPKVILWCAHTAEIERYGELLRKKKIGHTLFYGKMSRPQREQARYRFRDDRGCRVFVGQVDSGVGMNELVVADTAIYSSNSLKVVSRQQSMRRNRRKGSERHDAITYYDLVTEGSLDTRQCQSINEDMDFAKSILDSVHRGQAIRGLLS